MIQIVKIKRPLDFVPTPRPKSDKVDYNELDRIVDMLDKEYNKLLIDNNLRPEDYQMDVDIVDSKVFICAIRTSKTYDN